MHMLKTIYAGKQGGRCTTLQKDVLSHNECHLISMLIFHVYIRFVMSFHVYLQDQIRQAKKMKETKLKTRADPKRMQELRMKFVEQAKRYFGTPYAKKYWKKDGMISFNNYYYIIAFQSSTPLKEDNFLLN